MRACMKTGPYKGEIITFRPVRPAKLQLCARQVDVLQSLGLPPHRAKQVVAAFPEALLAVRLHFVTRRRRLLPLPRD